MSKEKNCCYTAGCVIKDDHKRLIVNYMLPFSINKALITGASSGLGKALAFHLAQLKIPLVLVARNEQNLRLIAQELSCHVQVEILAIDLSQAADRFHLRELIKEHCFELVINNAGIGLYGDFHCYASEHHKKIIDVNILAVTEICWSVSQALLTSGKQGVIMNISSVLADIPAPGMAVYGATKSYVKAFSLALDEELKKHGIRMLVSCPGQINTQFRCRASQGISKGHSPFLEMNPEKVAQAIWRQIIAQKPHQIVDRRYRWLAWVSRWLPIRWSMARIYAEVRRREAGKV